MQAPPDPPATPPARAAAALLVPVVAGLLLGCVRMTSFDLPRMLASADLRFGDRVTRSFYWPDPTWTGLDDKWGFALLCGLAWRAGGAAALTALNALFGAAAGAALFRLARLRSSPWTAASLAAAGVTVLSYRAQLRAEWISWVLVAFVLAHLRDVLGARPWRAALLVVGVMPLWAACHVYWFLGPAAVVAAAAGARSGRGLAIGAAAFLAAAVSPYGLANVAHPFEIVGQLASTDMAHAITELRVPFVSRGPFTYFHLVAAGAALATAWWTILHLRARRWPEAIVGALLLAVSLRYDRNLALVGVAWVFACPGDGEEGASRVLRSLGAVALPAVAGTFLAVPWFAPERTPGFGWDERAFPFALMDRIDRDRGGSGPDAAHLAFVNDFSLGSFVGWRLGRSFIDGQTHCYPAEHLAYYRRALEGGVSVHDVDARYPNDGWLLRTSGSHTRVLVVGLFLEGDYAPVDADDVATLFRPEPDPEKADRLWRAWLADCYLAAADAWFPSHDDALAATGGAPAEGDANAWRRLVVLRPWDRAFLTGLRHAYDVRGESVQAARIWRLARRLGE